ncbi:MAG: glycerophosphodiester phosphodiesterase, partial [Gemmatimonadetes bacterium]|nr:glycerophosphodiester phosphodiesterase [Gemmatimonadota bacterium]NIQ59831.1 glycerophosphodiester phosphodiesterase [Gemmatimonadota bacterium]NIU80034.1 glycerophosphodiester phosphodiesterase [Gammaproteobacteria bacterium]NIX19660.1 glycerophosphodiester phosphodiesterase [Actinomycetota bacterium]NIX48468.1 glycerophosphodiester phosphodiesterase [Gemmatimonadota bacterium]
MTGRGSAARPLVLAALLPLLACAEIPDTPDADGGSADGAAAGGVAGDLAEGDWPSYGGDPGAMGYSPL